MAGDGPYWVRGNCLWFRTEELIECSNLLRLEHFARVLNAARPDEERIGGTIRALMGMTKNDQFTFGARLLAEGEALRFRPVVRRTRVLPP